MGGALPLDPTGGTAPIPPLWSSSCFYFDITKRNLLRLAELWPILEVCMGMGKTGIPRVPWDSHGNGSKISHGCKDRLLYKCFKYLLTKLSNNIDVFVIF